MERDALTLPDASGRHHGAPTSRSVPQTPKMGLRGRPKATAVAFVLAALLALLLAGSEWAAAMSPRSVASAAWDLSARVRPDSANPAAALPAADLQSSGGTWEAVASPTTASLFSVSMVSAGEGWAVGGPPGGGGTILHYSNGSWQIAASPTSRTLRSVSMVSASEGWAVGDFSTILHYTGGSWQAVQSPTTNFLCRCSWSPPARAGPWGAGG